MNARTALLTLALLPVVAGARDLAPGTFELSGGTDVDFGKTTTSSPGTTDVESTVVSLDADALFYVAKNVGIGLGASYERSEVDFGRLGSSDSSQSVIGPQLKLSLPIAPQVSVLLGGMVGRMSMSSSTSDSAGLLARVDGDGWAFLVGGGLRLFAADFVSLDALLSYTKATLDVDGTDLDASGWNAGLALSVFFGDP